MPPCQQNTGGPPVSLPYGYLWWLVPSGAPRPILLASGYAGQMIWADPQLNVVIAGTSTVSQGSDARGQIIQLRGRLSAAAQRRAAAEKLESAENR